MDSLRDSILLISNAILLWSRLKAWQAGSLISSQQRKWWTITCWNEQWQGALVRVMAAAWSPASSPQGETAGGWLRLTVVAATTLQAVELKTKINANHQWRAVHPVAYQGCLLSFLILMSWIFSSLPSGSNHSVIQEVLVEDFITHTVINPLRSVTWSNSENRTTHGECAVW